MEQINHMLHTSVLVRVLAALAHWLGAQWRSSWLVRRVLGPLWHTVLCRRAGRWRGWWREHGESLFRGSAVCRVLYACAGWVAGQWRESRAVQAFLTPVPMDRVVSQGSIFNRLWEGIHRFLCLIHNQLHLERAADGSIFRQLWFLCLLPMVLAPLLPTMAAAALCVAAWLALAMDLARSSGRRLAYSPMNKYILLYVAVYAVCTFRSVDLRSSLPVGVLTIFFTLFALAVQNGVRTPRQMARTVKLMVLAAAAVSLYGIYQYLFRTGYQSQAWVDSDMFGSIDFRVASTLQNPNMLGQYLTLLIPLGGACLLTARSGRKRLLWAVCCGAMCVCMLLTFSRGAWLGLLCAGLLFVVLLRPRLLLLAPFVLAALFLFLPESVLVRFTSIGNLSDTSTNYRVSIWVSTLLMLGDYWICGVGPGTQAFNLVYPSYDIGAAYAQHSHNLFLQIACDGGVCALALFVLALFWYFKDISCALHREEDKSRRTILAAFLSGALGFLVQSMTDYSFYNYRVLLLFWVFLGLGATAARQLRGEEEEE